MAKDELFSGESKNIEYKVVENSCGFCQYTGWQTGHRY